MPKIRRERVRRHVVAAGVQSPEESEPSVTEEKASLLSTGKGIVWEPVKSLDLSILSTSLKVDALMSDAKNESSSSSSSSNSSTSSGSSGSSSSSSGGSNSGDSSNENKEEATDGKRVPVVKKQTKKEKIQARHEKFMNRLLLPGEKQKFETKKLDLSSLAEVIDAKEAPPVSLKMTSHTRKTVAASEINQFKLVFQHPSFQQDALAAIREHLQISNAAREEEAALMGPQKKKKQADRHHPYKSEPKPVKERAPKAPQPQKPNPNKGKHTRKKGRAETIRKR